MKKILAAVAAVLLIACVTGFVLAANTVPAYDQLMEAESLSDFRSILLAEENREEVSAFTLEEINSLSGQVYYLYAGVDSPTQDDIDTREELLETLSILPNGPESLDGDPVTYAVLPNTISGTTQGAGPQKGYVPPENHYTVSGTVTFDTQILIPYGRTITIESTAACTFKHGASYKAQLFFIEPGGTLILKGTGGTITIDASGSRGWNFETFWCQGSLDLNNVTVKNAKSLRGTNSVTGLGAVAYISTNTNTNESAYFTAAAYTNRYVSVQNCTFIDNDSDRAGGFYINGRLGTNITFKNVTFNNCDASDSASIGNSNAGAIYVDGSTMPLSIIDCTFTGCDADLNGGAIYCFNETSISGSTFTSCTANNMGGAIYVQTNKTVTISGNTNINGCTALSGSAIALGTNGTATVTVSNTTMQNCRATGTTAETVTRGTIFATSDSNYNLTVDGCTFQNNQHNGGGGIYWVCGSSATLTVKNSTFTNNTATRCSVTSGNTTTYYEGNGGAIYVNTAKGCTISGSTFTGNTAFMGGAININGPINMSGSDFSNNTTNNAGGSAYINGASEISNCDFTYTGDANTAGSGGAFYIVNKTAKTYNIRDCTFSGLKSSDGSAIMLGGNANTVGPTVVNLTRVLIENCKGSGTGGGIRSTGGGYYQLNLDQCVMRNNTHSRGACIYWNANEIGSKLTIKDSQFLNNSADIHGGAFFLEATCEISGDTGHAMTEPILTGDIPAAIYGTRIDGNSAGEKGGGLCIASFNNAENKDYIFFEGTENSVDLKGNVSLSDNSAENGGGIAYNISNSTCFRNGYIFNLKCDGATISGNTATENGGGIYLEYNPFVGNSQNDREHGTDLGYIARFTMSSGSVVNNNAKNGSGIYIGKGQCIIEGGQLNGNTATENGGAVYVTGYPKLGANETITGYIPNTSFTMSQGTFSNNMAVNGGAVAVSDGNVIINGGTMNANTASNNGGAVYVNGGNYSMDSGTLSNNTASNMGGGLAVNNGNVVIGRESCKGDDNGHSHPMLLNNVATKDGGGIAVTGGTTTMYCGTLDGNSCTENQAGSSYYQEQTTIDSIFSIYGGDLDIGVNVESGTFNDHRENEGYTVTYHAIYDATNVSTEQRVAGSFVTLPGAAELNNSAFVRSGKVLLGWSTVQGNETGFLPVGSSLTLTNDVNLYAVWKNETYSISYVLGDGTVSGLPTTYAVTTGSQIIKLNQPSPTTGKTFMGWVLTATDGNWTQSDINGLNLLAGGKYGNVTLTAQWQSVDYKITYNFGCEDYMDPGNPNGFTSSGLPITLLNPTRPGYTFTGWHQNSTSGAVITQLTAYQNYSLYATWSLNTYVATFDANGGDLTGSSSANYSITGSITLPTVTRPGYEFVGWRATAVEGNWQLGEAYSGGAGKYGKVTLQAQWERSLVDLTLNISGTEAGQSILVTITGTPTNGEPFGALQFAMVANAQGKATLTVGNLPVGKYAVVVDEDWSWRYDSSSAQLDGSDQLQVSTDSTVNFVFTQTDEHWLSNYSSVIS